MRNLIGIFSVLILVSACSPSNNENAQSLEKSKFMQQTSDLVSGEIMAVAYSGFREGQHPDRGAGASNPSPAEILEDLNILVDHGFGLIRLYDAGENSAATLELIQQHRLPLNVLLGIWLQAEVSNHEGCPWLDEPIPEDELERNRI